LKLWNALRSKTLNEFVRKRTTTKQADIEKAWNYAVEGSRGDVEVIVEALSNSIRNYVIDLLFKTTTLLLICAPINTRTVAIIKKAGNPPEFQTKNYTKLKIWPKKLQKLRWCWTFGVEFSC
jgi:phosphoribosylglycinamide formyltransferase 2